MEYTYPYKSDKDQTVTTETIAVDPTDFLVREFSRDAYFTKLDFHAIDRYLVRPIPDFSLTASWQETVALSDAGSNSTVSIFEHLEAGADFPGTVVLRIAAGNGGPTIGGQIFYGLGGLNATVTARSNGTSQDLGGKYTEWAFASVPEVVNFFPDYTKAGKYVFTIAFYDEGTALPLPTSDGLTVHTLAVTVTP